MDIEQFLQVRAISYRKFSHPAVFTCEESEALDIDIPGAHTKQLLMRDKKKRHFILAIVMHDKQVDTKALGAKLGTGSLGFASPEDLRKLLGVEPGSVTPFGLVFDTDTQIRTIFDEDAWKIGQFCFHPLVNTETLVIDQSGFQTFMNQVSHQFEIMSIPEKYECHPSMP